MGVWRIRLSANNKCSDWSIRKLIDLLSADTPSGYQPNREYSWYHPDAHSTPGSCSYNFSGRFPDLILIQILVPLINQTWSDIYELWEAEEKQKIDGASGRRICLRSPC